MNTTSEIITISSEWIAASLGVTLALFSALAWFVRSTVTAAVRELETRMERELVEIKSHLTDVADRTRRLEFQMDDTVIPRQADIARKLHADRREHDGGIHD